MATTQIDTVKQEPIWPWMQQPFGNWLYGMFYDINSGDFRLHGLEQYPGSLNPDVGQTGLPNVWNAWSPYSPGMDFLQGYLSNGNNQMDPRIAGGLQTALEWGGPGGRGTTLMNTLASHGTTGSLAGSAMENLMLTGQPSGAGNAVADMAKFGGSGEWGKQLIARAMGQPSAASAYLQPFLTMPTRGGGSPVMMPTPYRR